MSPEQRIPASQGITRKKESLTVEVLYESHLKRVYNYVLQRVTGPAEAEDVTAETFAAALEALPKFRGDCSPEAWLLGIARQKVAEAARRRSRRPERLMIDLAESEREAVELMASLDMGPLPEEVVLHGEARSVMRRLLDRLPEPQREALLLQTAEGLSIREIAALMGRSVAATNSLLERGRAAIFRLGRSYFVG
jgi:RNA polymerase sigma-70 factor (ECF subfamily)